MPYIIDGHNLIGRMSEISLSEVDDEQRLIELLQEFCNRAGRTAEVYFDNAVPGMPRARNYGRLIAYYTRAGKSADQAIFERLHRLGKEARNWTVVSSDRQVQAMAKAMHAKVLSSAEFARQLKRTDVHAIAAPPEKGDDPKIGVDELEEWLSIFKKNRPK